MFPLKNLQRIKLNLFEMSSKSNVACASTGTISGGANFSLIYLYTQVHNESLKLSTPKLDEEPSMAKPLHHLIEEA